MLIKYQFRGIKNIDTLQTISFSNYKEELKVLNEDEIFKITDNNVRGIFGLNGSGKSASLYALYILKDLVHNKYIIDNNETKNHLFINDLINKELKESQVKVEFLYNNMLYLIDVTLKHEGDLMYISKQVIYKKKNEKNARKTTMFNVEAQSSFFELHNRVIDEDFKNIYNFFNKFEIIPAFSEELKFIKSKSINLPKDLYNTNDDRISLSLTINEKLTFMDENQFEEYKKEIEIFKFFIKNYVKTDLIDIHIEKEISHSEGREVIVINDIVFDYGYKVSFKLESDGIKRLFKIISTFLKGLRNKKIVVIDEIDIYLHHDLIKLVLEYAQLYTEGQLIFTTHDLLIIDTLDLTEKAVIVVNNNHELTVIPKGNNSTNFNKYVSNKVENTKIIYNLAKIDEVLR